MCIRDSVYRERERTEEDMSESHKNKIVVVGAGNVGEAIAYTLMVRKQANDIVLVDVYKRQKEHLAASIDFPIR